MKLSSIISAAAAIVLLAGPASAAPPVPSFEAEVIQPDGAVRKVFAVAATRASVRFKETKDGTEIQDRRMTDFALVRVMEPAAYHAAVDLYQARRYQEAKAIFSTVAAEMEPVMTVPDNPGTLAAYHEMECLRKLGDLDGLSAALKKFNKDPLVRENHLRQIELYLMWDAVRTKDWNRVEALAKDRQKQRLPGCQRAQVAWCHAVALEAADRKAEALLAYDTALTADAGASEEIARKAALAILRIHAADTRVREALKRKPGGPAGTGEAALAEARAVALLFQLSVGAGEPLPEEYRVFLAP